MRRNRPKRPDKIAKYTVVKLPNSKTHLLMWRPKARYQYQYTLMHPKYFSMDGKWSYKIELARTFASEKAAMQHLTDHLFIKCL